MLVNVSVSQSSIGWLKASLLRSFRARLMTLDVLRGKRGDDRSGRRRGRDATVIGAAISGRPGQDNTDTRDIHGIPDHARIGGPLALVKASKRRAKCGGQRRMPRYSLGGC